MLSILKCLIEHSSFNKYKHSIHADYFENELSLIYDTLKNWHDKYGRTPSEAELSDFLDSSYPVMPKVGKQALQLALSKVLSSDTLGDDYAEDKIKSLHEHYIATQIANVCLDVHSGDASVFDIGRALSEYSHSFSPSNAEVPSDIDSILETSSATGEFKFNIPSLQSFIEGIGPGQLVINFARPEIGKTAWVVSMLCAPGGFVHQGLNCHYIGNEEPAERTMARCVTAITQKNIAQIQMFKDDAQNEVNQVKDNLHVFNGQNMKVKDLYYHAEYHRPDILVVDQLDKVTPMGNFAREDLKLQEVYVCARDIAKTYNCAVIVNTQASAEAEGHNILNLSMMAESRTSKAAEADIVFGIGNHPANDENTRMINILKNKVTGKKGNFFAIVNPEVSTFYS